MVPRRMRGWRGSGVGSEKSVLQQQLPTSEGRVVRKPIQFDNFQLSSIEFTSAFQDFFPQLFCCTQTNLAEATLATSTVVATSSSASAPPASSPPSASAPIAATASSAKVASTTKASSNEMKSSSRPSSKTQLPVDNAEETPEEITLPDACEFPISSVEPRQGSAYRDALPLSPNMSGICRILYSRSSYKSLTSLIQVNK